MTPEQISAAAMQDELEKIAAESFYSHRPDYDRDANSFRQEHKELERDFPIHLVSGGALGALLGSGAGAGAGGKGALIGGLAGTGIGLGAMTAASQWRRFMIRRRLKDREDLAKSRKKKR